MATAIETGKVNGRRELRFETFEEIYAEAQRLAGGEVRTIGNWSPGQILHHLAKSMDAAIDGSTLRAPWYMRPMLALMKKRMLTKELPAGFKIPQGQGKEFLPDDDITTQEGLAALRTAIDRMQTNDHREPHGAFGRLTHDQWNQLHCRHAELHLSFVLPQV